MATSNTGLVLPSQHAQVFNPHPQQRPTTTSSPLDRLMPYRFVYPYANNSRKRYATTMTTQVHVLQQQSHTFQQHNHGLAQKCLHVQLKDQTYSQSSPCRPVPQQGLILHRIRQQQNVIQGMQAFSQKCYNIPQQRNITSQQGNMIPLQGNIIPQQDNNISQQSHVIPQQSHVIPQQCDVLPRQVNIIPHQVNIIPHKVNIIPHQFNMSPHQVNSIPHQVSISQHQVQVLPQRSSTYPQQRHVSSQQSNSIHHQSHVHPQQSHNVPPLCKVRLQQGNIVPQQGHVLIQQGNIVNVPQQYHVRPQQLNIVPQHGSDYSQQSNVQTLPRQVIRPIGNISLRSPNQVSYTGRVFRHITDPNVLLLNAVRLSDVKATASLIQSGVYINGTTGTPPVVSAAASGSATCLQMLIDSGADVNLPVDPGGYTALMATVYTGHFECMKILVAAGANLDYKLCDWSDGETALIISVMGDERKDPITTCQYLLQHGANPNIRTYYNQTALRIAVKHGSLELIKTLVEGGADINDGYHGDGHYYLDTIWAFKKGRLDVVKYLMEEAGMDRDLLNKTGCLAAAVEHGRMYIVNYLMDLKNPEVSADVSYEGESALFYLIHRYGNNCLKDLPKLFERGANANEALHLAALRGCHYIVKYCMITGKVYPTVMDFIPIDETHKGSNNPKYERWRGTAVQKALLSGHVDIARYLVCNFFVHQTDLSPDGGRLRMIIDAVINERRLKDAAHQFIKELASAPKSLYFLSFVKASSCISQFACNSSDRHMRAVFSGLPPSLVRKIEFQNVGDDSIFKWGSLKIDLVMRS